MSHTPAPRFLDMPDEAAGPASSADPQAGTTSPSSAPSDASERGPQAGQGADPRADRADCANQAPRIATATLGCRLNQAESDALTQAFAQRGWQPVPQRDKADVYIVNSCTITHSADSDTRQLIRRLHRQAPQAQIVVTGCAATAQPKDLAQLPGVSMVVDNGHKEGLPDLLGSAGLPNPQNTPAPKFHVGLTQLRQKAQFAGTLSPARHQGRRRAYLKVQDGCDYQCSFCIVPHVRGRSRSLPVATLQHQLQALVAAGVPEVVLTGVHLGLYGRDLQPRLTLAQLIEALIPHLGPHTKLRLGSIDPHEATPDLIAIMAAHGDRICRYLHLPMQSGDSAVLRHMRRAHTAQAMWERIPTIVGHIPNIGIGADIIVGFPGETKAAFQHTYDLLEALPVHFFHVFPFSVRQGTPAAKLPNPVPTAIKKERAQALRLLGEQKRRAFVTSQAQRSLSAPLPVLPLVGRDKRSGRPTGLTDNYIRVLLPMAEAQKDQVRWQPAQLSLQEGYHPKTGTCAAHPVVPEADTGNLAVG